MKLETEEDAGTTPARAPHDCELAGDPSRVARFRAGDRRLQTELYRGFGPMVERTLRRGFTVRTATGTAQIAGLPSAFDVECAAQDVFVRAFGATSRAAYDGVRPFANYLHTIARNLLIDRARRTRNLVPLDENDDQLVVEVDVDAELVDAELSALVQSFLQRVPNVERRYFDLRYQEGLSQTDAAGTVGLTRIQGRRIEARLKSRLLGFLERHGHGGFK